MIASRSSFAGFLNFSCEYSAMYWTESEPNWSPVACGLNVYWRFRPSKTLEEIAVVIQRNRFCLSTFSASGTAWALE